MMSFGQTHLPYDKEDEGSAQHQGQHVAEGRKGERHGCSSQPYSQLWREKSGALLSTPPPPCPSSGSYLLLWASNFLLSSELSCVCVSSRWGLVSSVIRSRSCAVSHHALSFSVTAMVIRGGVASLQKGGELCRWPDEPRFNLWQAKCPSPPPHICVFSSARWAYTCCFSHSAAEAQSVCLTGRRAALGSSGPRGQHWNIPVCESSAAESWAVCGGWLSAQLLLLTRNTINDAHGSVG